jgi:hypothetical protein
MYVIKSGDEWKPDLEVSARYWVSSLVMAVGYGKSNGPIVFVPLYRYAARYRAVFRSETISKFSLTKSRTTQLTIHYMDS